MDVGRDDIARLRLGAYDINRMADCLQGRLEYENFVFL